MVKPLPYNQAIKITRKTESNAYDTKYQAEDDARTLAQANAIYSNENRLNNAKSAATNLIFEGKERVKDLNNQIGILSQLIEADDKKNAVSIKHTNGIPKDFPSEVITTRGLPRRQREVIERLQGHRW